MRVHQPEPGLQRRQREQRTGPGWEDNCPPSSPPHPASPRGHHTLSLRHPSEPPGCGAVCADLGVENLCPTWEPKPATQNSAAPGHPTWPAAARGRLGRRSLGHRNRSLPREQKLHTLIRYGVCSERDCAHDAPRIFKSNFVLLKISSDKPCQDFKSSIKSMTFK